MIFFVCVFNDIKSNTTSDRLSVLTSNRTNYMIFDMTSYVICDIISDLTSKMTYEITPDMASDMTFNRTSFLFFVFLFLVFYFISGFWSFCHTYSRSHIFKCQVFTCLRTSCGLFAQAYLLIWVMLFVCTEYYIQCSQCDPVGDNLANNTLGFPLYKIMNSS